MITPSGRIFGSPTASRWDDQTITVPIVSDYVKIRPGDAQFTIPKNYATVTHRYDFSPGQQWYELTCPTDNPYVDTRVPGTGDSRAVAGLSVDTQTWGPSNPVGGLGSQPFYAGSPATTVYGYTKNWTGADWWGPGHITVTLACTHLPPQ